MPMPLMRWRLLPRVATAMGRLFVVSQTLGPFNAPRIERRNHHRAYGGDVGEARSEKSLAEVLAGGYLLAIRMR